MRLVSLALALTAVASGQWIKYRTEGVPRDRSGKPNLSAPAPRTSDGKIDLSGMWTIADALPCPPIIRDDDGECLEKNPIGQPTADLNKYVPGGLPYTEWSLGAMQERKKDLDPHVKCLPSNFPRIYTLPHITKFIQTSRTLVLLNEFNASYRQIFLDGRPLPADPQPSWNGYSTGKWGDRDTLIVETNGFRDDLWMDMAGSPLTNAAHVTERFRRPNFGKLEVEAAVNDPKAYKKPFTMTLALKLVVDTELIDEVCLEGENSAKHMK
jgi:hypothetical protein